MTAGSNVEIKARVSDLVTIRDRLRTMGYTSPRELNQRDVFFSTQPGRLKLRILSPVRGELIYYQRPDGSEPRVSRYLIAPCPAPEALRSVLDAALGTRGVVQKRRDVYLIDQTRVHLDEVDHLGSFVEIEVVLLADQPVDEGERIVRSLLTEFNIDENALIGCAYIDLLERLNKNTTS